MQTQKVVYTKPGIWVDMNLNCIRIEHADAACLGGRPDRIRQ